MRKRGSHEEEDVFFFWWDEGAVAANIWEGEEVLVCEGTLGLDSLMVIQKAHKV